jgi:homoserine O-acetyltransferase
MSSRTIVIGGSLVANGSAVALTDSKKKGLRILREEEQAEAVHATSRHAKDCEFGRRHFLHAIGAIGAIGLGGSQFASGAAATERPGAEEGVFELGTFALESGMLLPNAKIAYKTHGRLNAAKSNAILYPTQIAAQHGDIEWPIGPGKALDPERYFIVILDQLGNGLSSSPSNSPAPYDRARFPTITIRDDVAAQRRLVTERLGIRRVALVVGYSMGAQQTYQWAASHADMVERIAPFCGTAKTTPHNAVFLQGLRAALTADAAWMGGDYREQPVLGMRAFARVYAGWGLSQSFYKQELWRQMGFDSLASFLTGFWEQRYGRRDANNLLSMVRTWELNDLGATPGMGGSLEHALGAIKAKTTIMAGQTDMYFTAEDMKAEAGYIPGAQFRIIPSLWGHMAGAGLNPADSKFIETEIKALLSS